jgi:hypothetical protein
VNWNSSPRITSTAIQEKIEAIPSAMRQMGWGVSAQLMERWLGSPAWSLPEAWKKHHSTHQYTPSHTDSRIVQMDWAMRHPRTHANIRELRSKMANEAAKQLLRDRMADLHWGKDSRVSFGSRQDCALQLENSCQANWQQIGSKLDPFDDMYGGLGMATLKVALIGEAMRDMQTGRQSLRVTDAGFYVRDTYDFSGPQYLGTWTKSRVLSKRQWLGNTITDGLTFNWGKPEGHLSNGDFDRYRRATGFGGDFVIYSDVYWESADLLLDLT